MASTLSAEASDVNPSAAAAPIEDSRMQPGSGASDLERHQPRQAHHPRLARQLKRHARHCRDIESGFRPRGAVALAAPASNATFAPL